MVRCLRTAQADRRHRVNGSARRRGAIRSRLAVVALSLALACPACSSLTPAGGHAPAAGVSPSATARFPATAGRVAAPLSCPAQVFARLTEAQRVGQLFLVGFEGDPVSEVARTEAAYHFGSWLFPANGPAGDSPVTVATHGVAFIRGMREAGVATTAKHFPGLGRVHGNTDFTAGVVDTVTRPDDPYLRSYQAAVDAGVPLVMVALATYTRIDTRHLAVFSPRVMRVLLHQQEIFHGVIISDYIAATAD